NHPNAPKILPIVARNPRDPVHRPLIQPDESSSSHGGFDSSTRDQLRRVAEVVGGAIDSTVNTSCSFPTQVQGLHLQNAATSSNNSGIQHDVRRQHAPAVEEHSSEHLVVQVCSEDEAYYEDEDVVCSQPMVPHMGMVFDTPKEAYNLYNDYAFKMGFSIRIASSRKSSVTKELIRKEWECNHARKADSEGEGSNSASTSTNDFAAGKVVSKKKRAEAVLTVDSRKRNTIKKFDCKAHMAIGLRNGQWEVIVMQPEHTHPLVKQIGQRKQLRSHRKISWADYEMLQTLHGQNISTSQIMGVLGDIHGGVGNLTFNTKDVSNLRTNMRGRLQWRDMDATVEYFCKLQAESPSFFHRVMIDEENVVRGLFWMDGRTRELCKHFRDCIFFDTTFCTNRYDMPFAPIVGINNNLHSILLGTPPKHGSAPERCSGMVVVASFDHLFSKYFSGISSTSRCVKTFRIWGNNRPSRSNMLQEHTYVVASLPTETVRTRVDLG
ncbi:unnamed protein product, partial [Urochloa humidicola]